MFKEGTNAQTDRQYKAELLAVIRQCPHGEPEPSCPLADLRKQPPETQHTSIAAIPANLTRTILKYHYACSEQREFARRQTHFNLQGEDSIA